jgi:hypothetical protein
VRKILWVRPYGVKRRELAAWVGLAALGVFLMALCAVVGWSMLPREQLLPLGPQTNFPIDEPEYRAVDTQIHIFVINLHGELIAWDASAAVDQPCSLIKWVPTNNRFEDPCTAGKWCLDGAVADSWISPGSAIRTLDRFRLEVDRDGNVWLNPDQKIQGQPVPTAVSHDLETIRHACDYLIP